MLTDDVKRKLITDPNLICWPGEFDYSGKYFTTRHCVFETILTFHTVT